MATLTEAQIVEQLSAQHTKYTAVATLVQMYKMTKMLVSLPQTLHIQK